MHMGYEEAMELLQITEASKRGPSQMKVNRNENVVFYDCDDTLVMWDDKFREPHKDEFTGKEAIPIFDPNDRSVNYLIPHQRHIELLKKHHGRGYHVVVWSGGGFEWAESVVKTLGLEEFVDDVYTKPCKFVDDLPATEVLGTRIYLKDL